MRKRCEHQSFWGDECLIRRNGLPYLCNKDICPLKDKSDDSNE